MGPGGINEDPAATHRQDLLREAQQARLAAEATAATGGMWSRAVLSIADVLLYAGHWLRAYAAHARAARAHAGLQGETVGVCHYMHHHHAHDHTHDHAQHHDEAFPQRIVWLEV